MAGKRRSMEESPSVRIDSGKDRMTANFRIIFPTFKSLTAMSKAVSSNSNSAAALKQNF